MVDSTEWSNFYNAIKDDSWPPCKSINDVLLLPPDIQLEIIKDHLFLSYESIISGKIKHTEQSIPNFLYYVDNVKSLLGPESCLMNNQDVIFLYSVILSKRPQYVLEIGRFKGWSSAIIYGALEQNNIGHLFSVDIKDWTTETLKKLIKNRTTFIDVSSNELLDIKQIKNIKFEVFFIDGDHSYNAVLSDLTKSFELSANEAWFLLHDADMAEVLRATEDFLSVNSALIDCGTYGEKIRLLYKRTEK